MKLQEKAEKAMILRNQGLSCREIARRINASASSVSTWVRSIVLTEDLKAKLKSRSSLEVNPRHVIKCRILREKSQENGAAKASVEGFNLHLAGCMLYWAEGTKSKNVVQFTNSDAEMIRLFLRFLRESLIVNDEDIRFGVKCYLNNGLSKDEVIEYWRSVTGLSIDHMYKIRVNETPSSSKKVSKARHVYGECRISISRTDVVQKIYGSIQQYVGFKKEEWLNG